MIVFAAPCNRITPKPSMFPFLQLATLGPCQGTSSPCITPQHSSSSVSAILCHLQPLRLVDGTLSRADHKIYTSYGQCIPRTNKINRIQGLGCSHMDVHIFRYNYPLVNLQFAIENDLFIVDLPIQNGDVPVAM